jgi:hypothetical protein
MKCKNCGKEMVQRPRWRLLTVGVLMILWNIFAVISLYFLIPGVIFAAAGIYLIVWATLGKGYWCRVCKQFNVP